VALQIRQRVGAHRREGPRPVALKRDQEPSERVDQGIGQTEMKKLFELVDDPDESHRLRPKLAAGLAERCQSVEFLRQRACEFRQRRPAIADRGGKLRLDGPGAEPAGPPDEPVSAHAEGLLP
jgi:hypothetical protein